MAKYVKTLCVPNQIYSIIVQHLLFHLRMIATRQVLLMGIRNYLVNIENLSILMNFHKRNLVAENAIEDLVCCPYKYRGSLNPGL